MPVSMSVKMVGDRRLCGKGSEFVPNTHISRGVEKSNEFLVDTADEGGSSLGSNKKTTADMVTTVKSAVERQDVCNDFLRSSEETDDMTSFYSPASHVAELSKIERIGVISVLEDCIDQMYILGKTNRKATGSIDMQYRSLKERFSDREQTKIELEEKSGKAEATRDTKKMIKLQRDRATLEAILQKTLEELKLKKSFKTLVKASELEVQQQNEEAELISAEERNVKETNKLHNILEGDLKKGMDKMNKKSDTIAWLKDEIHDTLFMNDLKFKYISKWERAREEQNGARLSHSEKRLQDRLIDLQDSTDMELRSHVEIEMYLKQAITNLGAEIERWMEKYNTELEDRETELQNLQAKRAMKYKELQALASLYQERQKEIDAYLAYKEKQAAKAAHEAFLYRMATIIQAWWRGTMVRRGLGPYKKSKRGKDKKGKGKGGKGGPKKKI